MLMVKAQGPGRPPGDGPRYDCGRRKPSGDPRGELIWRRIADDAVAMGLDKRVATQLSRLSICKRLTDTQVRAGFLVARIYADFERWHGRTRFTREPGFVRWISSPDDPSPKGKRKREPDEQDEHERMLHADRRMRKLQRTIHDLPPLVEQRSRDVLERLCVEDLPIGEAALDLVTPLLDYIAGRFNLGADAKLPSMPSIAITARRPARKATPPRARGTNLAKEAWMASARQLAPDADTPTLELEWAKYQARLDRDRYRGEKADRRK